MKWTTIPQWPAYAAIGATIRNAERLGEEVLFAAQSIATNSDLSAFQPKTKKVASAIGDFDRLRARFAKLSANGFTPRELQTNRAALATTYRSAFQKLKEACAASVTELKTRPIPPEWGWLDNERKTTIERLQALQNVLDAEIKKEPPF